MASQKKDAAAAVSKRMKAVIAVMLLIILLPVTVASSPTARIVITVENMDSERSANIRVRLSEGDYGWQESVLLPGEEHKSSFHVTPGTHVLQLYYWHDYNASYYHGQNSLSRVFTLVPFETESATFRLQP